MKKKNRKGIVLLMTLVMLFTNFNVYAESDMTEQVSDNYTITLVNDQTGKIFEITPDVISNETEKNARTGETKQQLVVEMPIPGENITNGAISPRMSVMDGSCTVKITLNVNYTQSGTKYKMTSATGSFKRIDPGFAITNKKVLTINMQDFNSAPKEYTVNGTNFSYGKYSNWVDAKCAVCHIEAHARCKISRGSSSFTLSCNNVVLRQGVDLLG